MKVFINDLSHEVHASLAAALSTQGYVVVGSVPSARDAADFPFTTALIHDGAAVKELMASADTIVLSLLTSIQDEVEELVAGLAYMEAGDRKRLILLSSVVGWGRTERRPMFGSGGSASSVGSPLVAQPPPSVPATMRTQRHSTSSKESYAFAAAAHTTRPPDPMALTQLQQQQQQPRKMYTEEDYALRRPVASWSELRHVESQVLAGMVADKLHTCVLAAGLVYDETGGAFRRVFRDAWFNHFSPVVLPCMGSASNALPVIHTQDLVAIITALIRTAGAFDCGYMLAAEPTLPTLGEVCGAIAGAVGSGAVRPLTKDEFQDQLLTDPALPELQLDLGFLSVDDCTVSRMIKQGQVPGISDYFTKGILNMAPQLSTDFTKSYGFPVVKLLIVGPPCSGKTWLARRLAQKYKLPLLGLDDVLRLAAESAQDPEVKQAAAAAAVTTQQGSAPRGILNDDVMARVLKEVLQLRPCTVQGYILDGVVSGADSFKTLFTTRRYGPSTDPTLPPPELLDPLVEIAPSHVVMIQAAPDLLAARYRQLHNPSSSPRVASPPSSSTQPPPATTPSKPTAPPSTTTTSTTAAAGAAAGAPLPPLGEKFDGRMALWTKPSVDSVPLGWAPPVDPKKRKTSKSNLLQQPPSRTFADVAFKALGKEVIVVNARDSEEVAQEVKAKLEQDVGPQWLEALEALQHVADGMESTAAGAAVGGSSSNRRRSTRVNIIAAPVAIKRHKSVSIALDDDRPLVKEEKGSSAPPTASTPADPPTGAVPPAICATVTTAARSREAVIPEAIKPQELQDLESESALLRTYLMDNVMPVLAKALLQTKVQHSSDPIEDVAQACLLQARKLEEKAEAEAFLLYQGAVAKQRAKFYEELERMKLAQLQEEEMDKDEQQNQRCEPVTIRVE